MARVPGGMQSTACRHVLSLSWIVCSALLFNVIETTQSLANVTKIFTIMGKKLVRNELGEIGRKSDVG